MAVRILVVDNYDSFVYNLVQALGELGAEPLVRRNDDVDAAQALELRPDAVLLSPGPGRPEDAGVTLELVDALAGELPMLGVCLGHQAIGQAFGAKVVQGLRHRTLPVEGVQFHPESILTPDGPALLRNWLAQVAGARAS